jgi:hypothetical protein
LKAKRNPGKHIATDAIFISTVLFGDEVFPSAVSHKVSMILDFLESCARQTPNGLRSSGAFFPAGYQRQGRDGEAVQQKNDKA